MKGTFRIATVVYCFGLSVSPFFLGFVRFFFSTKGEPPRKYKCQENTLKNITLENLPVV